MTQQKPEVALHSPEVMICSPEAAAVVESAHWVCSAGAQGQRGEGERGRVWALRQRQAANMSSAFDALLGGNVWKHVRRWRVWPPFYANRITPLPSATLYKLRTISPPRLRVDGRGGLEWGVSLKITMGKTTPNLLRVRQLYQFHRRLPNAHPVKMLSRQNSELLHFAFSLYLSPNTANGASVRDLPLTLGPPDKSPYPGNVPKQLTAEGL